MPQDCRTSRTHTRCHRCRLPGVCPTPDPCPRRARRPCMRPRRRTRPGRPCHSPSRSSSSPRHSRRAYPRSCEPPIAPGWCTRPRFRLRTPIRNAPPRSHSSARRRRRSSTARPRYCTPSSPPGCTAAPNGRSCRRGSSGPAGRPLSDTMASPTHSALRRKLRASAPEARSTGFSLGSSRGLRPEGIALYTAPDADSPLSPLPASTYHQPSLSLTV